VQRQFFDAIRQMRPNLVAAGTLMIALSGCVSSPVSNTPPEVPGSVRGGEGKVAPIEESTPDASAEIPAEPAPQPRALTEQFYAAAAEAQQNEDWQGAIEQAERGLRVDRRQPGLYLILAQSYWQLGQESLATNFARQGLRYLSGSESAIKAQLDRFAYPSSN